MPDNLTISIGADTSKVRGEIRLLQAEIQNLGRGLRAAVKAGDTAGAQTISQHIGRMQSQLAGLNQTLRQTEGAGESASRGIELTARSFRSLHAAVINIGNSIAGARAGIVAFAAIRGFEALIKNLDDVDDRLRKIRQSAREAGVSTLAMQAAGRQAMQAGQDPEVGQRALSGFAKAVAAAKQKEPAENTGGVLVQRGTELRDGGGARMITTATNDFSNLTQVIKGGKANLIDFNDEMKTLGVLTKNIKTPEDIAKALPEAIKHAIDLGKQFPIQMNQLSQRLFGMPLATLEEISKNSEKLAELIAKISGTESAATKERLDQINQLDKARNRLLVAWEELDAKFANSLRQTRINNTQAVAEFVEGLPARLDAFQEYFVNFWPQLQKDSESSWKTFNDNFKANFGQTLQEMLAGWGAFFQSLIEQSASTATAIAQNLKQGALSNPEAVISGAPGTPFATGGMVRGPGGPTSDSILARLSNGEFVMSAGAVQRWGAGLLASMNGGGGMPRLGRFADGGLVAAGAGGTPVHLHLGGQSFALAGNQSVVNALVIEAHRHRIRSTGTKPSWYGGTPSGR